MSGFSCILKMKFFVSKTTHSTHCEAVKRFELIRSSTIHSVTSEISNRKDIDQARNTTEKCLRSIYYHYNIQSRVSVSDDRNMLHVKNMNLN